MNRISTKTENFLYFKVSACFESLDLALRAFEEFLKEQAVAALPVYYRARTHLRDAQRFYDEALNEAKRLLGPLPMYPAPEFEKWRTEFLSQHHIIMESQDFEAMRYELLQDRQLIQWMGQENIERLLAKDFEAQKIGKRKLENIKVRIVFDRLKEVICTDEQLKKEAMEKLQGAG